MTRRILAIVLFLFLIPAQVLAQAVIDLKEEVWIAGDVVLLGDIAELSGDPEMILALAEVNVGTAPLSGSSRRLTTGQIEVRLRQAGINPKEVEFKGSAAVRIHRGTSLPTETVQSQTFPVVVAARDIPRMHVISAADLEVRYEARQGVNWNSGSIEEFIGKRAVRHFTSGTILTLGGVEVPPVVERGSSVLIVSGVGGVQVTAPGVARAAGGVGEVIPVENTVSRQIVYGEIIDSETVFVNIGGQGQ